MNKIFIFYHNELSAVLTWMHSLWPGFIILDQKSNGFAIRLMSLAQAFATAGIFRLPPNTCPTLNTTTATNISEYDTIWIALICS